MKIIDHIWLTIRGLFLNWIISLLILISSNSNVTNNNKSRGSKNEDNGDCDLPEGLRREMMPRHVAMILDGNRRWAKQRGLTFMEGYEAGAKAMTEILRTSSKFTIPVLSLFVFSSENWNRPQHEVAFLMKLIERTLKDIMGSTLSRGGRVTIIGDTSRFPTSLQKVIKDIEEVSKNNTKFHILIAMGYSGQYDIVQACQNIASKVKDGLVEPEDITSSSIEQELKTMISDFPNPDLLIRTSGELRISNYYLWQSAYTEMYFTDKHWPDFGEDEFVQALRSFQQRGRRFGKN